jgi:hypothetical protein
MNTRKPVCLTVTSIFQLILAGYLLFCFLAPQTRGAGEGYSANFGTGVLIGLGLVGIYFLGILLAIASLLRREAFRAWAGMCLALYCVPIAIVIWHR